MAQPNQTQNQTTQIIAKNRWYEIYREVGDTVRIITKYVDYYDAGVYAMRILEISGDAAKLYVKWNMPERKEAKLIKTVRLDDAAQWRNRMLSVSSITEFERLIWELEEVATKE